MRFDCKIFDTAVFAGQLLTVFRPALSEMLRCAGLRGEGEPRCRPCCQRSIDTKCRRWELAFWPAVNKNETSLATGGKRHIQWFNPSTRLDGGPPV